VKNMPNAPFTCCYWIQFRNKVFVISTMLANRASIWTDGPDAGRFDEVSVLVKAESPACCEH
jgi:hypothetical protein